MNDLLDQAIRRLSPEARAEINLGLARIQNSRNARHTNKFCNIPEFDLADAIYREAKQTMKSAAWMWDSGQLVGGLS